ncbi:MULTISPECIES: sugar-binding transcriptional regulator [Rhizobium]|uniref:Sugar-binding transcriptional regulator n=2 Tax=Rhizobium TaxID=379 RepID=A0ABX6PR22_9HYPH|nr:MULTISPECIES: sugar-binding transcriptional regulator [Rhizobium]QIJ45404.1 sugar-binding transcriptional regulator [Rhizobium leguminosarum]NKL19269.1 sugar-binding transcriptional regulator [Rhizobium leguminosarum bv. viciae]NKL38262.1 sugar-binding transcriptional regulator [Rhizobium leguminosarum bv. viciae]NKL57697.1 sugar-binding transcriptional regulator [Rhizobium leguminosarum bv. viciae]QKK21084.1 sugar-binding transcriptional regulator [Rhizobium indicum]
MTKLTRMPPTSLLDAESLRLKAAFLYYNQKLTQNEVAAKLGVSRSTIVKLLDEALKRGEIQIWVKQAASELELASELEAALNLDEVIVTPPAKDVDGTARAVGQALGQFLSDTIPNNATIGVGWGRTLSAALSSFRPLRREGVKIVSLLGGTVEAQHENPIDFTWQLANQLGAQCFLLMAPLLVDSPDTKERLIEKCGLNRIMKLSADLDIALVSVGDIGTHSTSLSVASLAPEELETLISEGAMCDVLCNFLDRDGRTVDHPVNDRVMSVDLDTVRRARHVVIASGGEQRAAAILAAIRRIGCNTLVTDESAARQMLSLLRGPRVD